MFGPSSLTKGTLPSEKKTCLMALVKCVCLALSNVGIVYSII